MTENERLSNTRTRLFDRGAPGVIRMGWPVVNQWVHTFSCGGPPSRGQQEECRFCVQTGVPPVFFAKGVRDDGIGNERLSRKEGSTTVMKRKEDDDVRTFQMLLGSLLIAVLAAVAFNAPGHASYTAMVGKDLTADGSVLFFHQEDLSRYALHHVRVTPRQTHDLRQNPNVQLYWIEIPQVRTTYGYIAGHTFDDDYVPGGLSFGVNEHGVAIGMNVGYPKEPLPDRDGMLWSDFMKIVLERATTAAEAVEILAALTETYHNTDDPGQIFGIADPNEAWVFEASVTRWVAKRVPDDGMWVIANRYTIGTEWDRASEDLVEFAIENGWYDPERDGPFHFSRVYTRDTYDSRREWFPNRPYDYLREARSYDFLAKAAANGGVTVQDVMELMRDHYNGTFLYHDPPHQSPYRNIEISRTVSSIVAQLRSDMPDGVGHLAWITLSPPATTPYLPFHVGITSVAAPVETGVAYNGMADFDPDSAWWSFSVIRDQVEQDWGKYFPIVQNFWRAFEQRVFLQTEQVESLALEAYERGNVEAARAILTDFSARIALEAHAEAHRLRAWLEAVGAEL